jgi:replicative superfamily II helicase
MALYSTFVGVDRHRDLGIRDLTGARRDATALWALFSDTLPGITAALIVDADATIERVRRALDETLGAAGPDDTVIITFSGHGTHDHRLVAHDTASADLHGTTIPMDEVVSRLRQSHAGAVLCVLDCCFSGGAPARVLEDSPVPRDAVSPLLEVVGKGRVLIAASNVDEPAYELPGSGHGILTKAIIDVLRGEEGQVSLPTAVDKITSRVRAEAERIGVTQTPVFFNYVEGGLVLPALRAGERFFAAFPELSGVRVGRNISELAAFGLPAEVTSAWASQFTAGLNDLQLEAVNEQRVLDGVSLLVVAPTSAGKTFVGEMAAARAVTEGRKAAFLLPYRALVNEKYGQFSALYGERLGMRVVRCTGDYSDQTSLFVRGKYDLALLTYEMFLNLAVSNPALLNQLGLVVIDEAQFITDPNRGVSVELLLTHLLAAREKGVAPQLIALSAVIGEVNDFDAWLGARRLVTDTRPVPLIEGVLDRSGSFRFVDAEGREQETQLLAPGAVRTRREKPSAQDVIVPLVRSLIAKGEKVIVFRNQRGPAQGCANYLAQDLSLPPATGAIDALPTHDLTSTSATLRACLAGGTAFHNTNLTREEKDVVERAFRDPESPVRVLAATTTVAAGINTPASTVILAEQEFIGEDGRQFTVAEYKNMAGRAGRLGFNEEGKAIVLAGNRYERDVLFNRYVRGSLESFRSSFDPRQLDTWIVRLLAQVDRVPREDVARLLANTYGGFLAGRDNPKWRVETEERLDELLTKMLSLGLVEQDGDALQLTLLGRACGRSTLPFGSVIRLVDLLRRTGHEGLTPLKLMALLQVIPESDGGYTPMMKRGTAESVRQREAAQKYGPETVRAMQSFARDEWDYLARCKRAALLWDWVSGVPLETIEQRYTPNPFQGRIGHGDVRKFADATRYHLRSAHQIASVMFVGEGPSEESVEALLRQLEAGLPAEALGLLSLPVSLSRGEYLALHAAGVSTSEQFWATAEESLASVLGVTRAEQCLKLRPGREEIGA